ncbi:MAG: hypothetical protein ABR515_01080 [Nitrososphaeraceae archaeon]
MIKTFAIMIDIVCARIPTKIMSKTYAYKIFITRDLILWWLAIAPSSHDDNMGQSNKYDRYSCFPNNPDGIKILQKLISLFLVLDKKLLIYIHLQ